MQNMQSQTQKIPSIDALLVQNLISEQFPQWKDLPIRPVTHSGWDNRTFHLGDQMLVRLPSAARYEVQVEKEQKWLPKLSPFFSLEIPKPIAMGQPSIDYPWKWSIYRWIEGETLAASSNLDLCKIARSLAEFIKVLHQIDTKDGPLAGPHSFHRGGSLTVYDEQVRQSFAVLKETIDIKLAEELWDKAMTTTWNKVPVWVHGDLSSANILVKESQLSAVIDFGQLSVGDPACDLVMAWSYFKDESREIFRSTLGLDVDTWCRGRAWVLWKFATVAAGLIPWNAFTQQQALQIVGEVLEEHKSCG